MLYSIPCGLTCRSGTPSRAATALSASICSRTNARTSSGGKCSSRRPKPSRSGKPGCAPAATPKRAASRSESRIVPASPACPPQAMFALLTTAMTVSSCALPSPRSAFRSILVMSSSVVTRPA